MVGGVEMSVDGSGSASAALQVRLLGPLAVSRDGQSRPLPASRKVRALFAYLALTPHAVSRTRLCELLWETPDDPRGELRWCLSKIRTLLGEADRARLIAVDDGIRLDLDGCAVDARLLSDLSAAPLAKHATPALQQAAMLCGAELLDGLDFVGSAAFGGWLTAQRLQLRDAQIALLHELLQRADAGDPFAHFARLMQLAPFDLKAHAQLLGVLLRSGRVREAEAHLAATCARFAAENLDEAPLRRTWQALRQPPAPVGVMPAAPDAPLPGAAADEPRRHRASIAILPFRDDSDLPVARGGVAEALARDITTRLAKLRSLFVIAHGSTAALRERGLGADEAGRLLKVDYVVDGVIRIVDARLSLEVELAQTDTGRIVWSEHFHEPVQDAFAVLEQIGNRIVAAVSREIEILECQRAILLPPNSLGAWEAHHRGLWHMYRFTRDDNAKAQREFETAVRLDPTFSRAHAGLSFTHFQNAFLGWAAPEAEAERAFAAAGESLMADDRDPGAHWAMGRALWLRGDSEHALGELGQAIALSPNHALAHYSLAFVQSQSGDAHAAIAAADLSLGLSPFDPLVFAMHGARAMALVRAGQPEAAADWAVRAASRPNAHAHIYAIATFCLALAGRLDEARTHATALRARQADYALADFLRAFRFDADGAALFTAAARRIGLG